METREKDVDLVLGMFCDKQLVSKYFANVRESLLIIDNFSAVESLRKFRKCLLFFQNTHLLSSDYIMINEYYSDNIDIETVNDMLLSILEILSEHIIGALKKIETDTLKEYYNNLFETVVLLLRILLNHRKSIEYYKLLFENLSIYFNEHTVECEKYCNEIENEELWLYYAALNFFWQILKTIPIDSRNIYVSDEALIKTIHTFCLSDRQTINFLINSLLPSLMIAADHDFKVSIILNIWNFICSHFSLWETKPDRISCLYNLLCYLSEQTVQMGEAGDNSIYDNVTFWKFIQCGLSRCESYTRKRCLYIFKLLLSYFDKQDKNVTVLDADVPVFRVSAKYISIWADIVTLFETLEEKQVHIIKPVLSKFSKLVSLTIKETSSSFAVTLHTSWIICTINRMLIHESKYIIRWTLTTVLNMNFKTCPIEEQNSRIFLKIIIGALNDQTLYIRMDEEENISLSLSSEKLSIFFKNYISCIPNENEKVELLRHLLKIISSQSWCGVALLHIISALSVVESFPAWNRDDLQYIRKLLIESQQTQESAFKFALCHYIIECCLILLDWKSLNFEDLCELIILFRSKEISQRMPQLWIKIESKLQELFNQDFERDLIREVKIFCVESIKKIQNVEEINAKYDLETFEIKKIAVILTVLSKLSVPLSCNSENNQLLNWSSILESLVPSFVSLSKRPYMPIKKILNILQLITFLLEESLDVGENVYKEIIKCFHNIFDIVEFIYNKIFVSVKDTSVISHNYIFLNALKAFSTIEEFQGCFLNLVKDFDNKFENITIENSFIMPTVISFWKILNFNMGHFNSDENCELLSLKHLRSLNFHILTNIIAKYDFTKIVSCTTFESKEYKEEWMKTFRESISDFWTVAHKVISSFTHSELSDILLPLSERAKKCLNEGPTSSIVPIIKCLKAIVPNLGKTYLIYMQDLLDVSWKVCLELRGNENFRPAFKYFVEVLFQPEMFQEMFFTVIYKYIENFKELAENCVGIFYIVIKQFSETFKLTNLLELQFDFVPLLSFSLTYGPIHHKGQRILEETLVYMVEHCNFDIDSAYDGNKPSFFVRLTATMYVLENLSEESAQNENVAITVINYLMDMDKKVVSSRSSRFANSYCHRVRNRIWQSVIILQTSIVREDLNKQIIFSVLDILCLESQQPSVRCLLEWIILKILISHRILFNDFMLYVENSSEKRPSHLISLLSILNHVFIYVENTEWAILKCFPLMIGFCMAQNFNVRLHARLTIMNCLSLCEKRDITSVLEKYDYLSQIMLSQNSSETGNFSKNLKKLAGDFYFSVFHPVEHFSLESILFDIPRLTNLTSDELIKPSFFKIFLSAIEKSKIPFYNADDILSKSSPTFWSNKPEEKDFCENTTVDFNFQKKICPWKDGVNLFEKLNVDVLNGKHNKEGLIVIASLIDRIPNLGGLCRTCEIFGVHEFVIGCMKYIEDKQFQNLAVSADKWVSIKEIKSYHLREYLMSLREKGYTLIGVEQTDNSKKLTKYEFPKNAALLLGHEKEGLPVDLIQLLDVCVEIPQHGVIRSLNVHVSGAILIWEYARQHHFNMS